MSGATPDSLPIIVPRSSLRAIISLIGSGTAAGLLVYWQLERGAEWTPEIIAVIWAGWAAHTLKRILERKPKLIISEDGINVDHWESPMIRWEEFASVKLVKVEGSEHICLNLRDPEAFHASLDPMRRGLHTVTRKTGFGDIVLSLRDARLNAAAVFAVVQHQLEHARANPKPPSAVRYPLSK